MANNEFSVKMDSRRGSSDRSTPIPNRRYVSSPKQSRRHLTTSNFGPRSSSFSCIRERQRDEQLTTNNNPFNRATSESCRLFDRQQIPAASSTRLFNGGTGSQQLSGRRAISVDDQLNSMRLTEQLEQRQLEQRQPFKQPSTRTLNTRLMSEMRRRLTQLKEVKDLPSLPKPGPPDSLQPPGLEDLHGNYSSLTGVATISLSAESEDFVYTPGQIGSEKSPRFRERLSRQLMY